MIVENAVDEKWKLCCSALHKSEVIYFVQVSFLFMLSTFAIVQIVKKADNPEIYFSLLASCLGIIVPSPSLTKDK